MLISGVYANEEVMATEEPAAPKADSYKAQAGEETPWDKESLLFNDKFKLYPNTLEEAKTYSKFRNTNKTKTYEIYENKTEKAERLKKFSRPPKALLDEITQNGDMWMWDNKVKCEKKDCRKPVIGIIT